MNTTSKKRSRAACYETDIDELLLEFEASAHVGNDQTAIIPYQEFAGKSHKRICLQSVAAPCSVSIEEKQKTNARIKEEWRKKKQSQDEKTVFVQSPFGMSEMLKQPTYTAAEVKQLIEDRERALYQGYMALQDELKMLRNVKARCGWIREGEVG